MASFENTELKDHIRSTDSEQEMQAHAKPGATPEYLHGIALYSLMFALLLVCLLLGLDVSIISTAIPRITDEFHTIADIGWYGAAFSFAIATLQPLSGKIYTFFPMKTAFIGFVLIFELGSLLCATAVASPMFITGRTVAGVGASGLINGALSIVGTAGPPEKRPMLMGLIMSFASATQIGGPLVGGILTSKVSWRWCFYINLPIGAVTVAFLTFVKFPMIQLRGKKKATLKSCIKDFDLVGVLLFAPTIVMFMMALQWAGSRYPWSSATIIGLLCGAVGALIPLCAWEHRAGESALFPFALLRVRAVYSCCATSFLIGGVMGVNSYYLPLWFQTVKDASPIRSAVNTLPTFGSQILCAIALGVTVPRFIPYLTPFAIVGGLLSVIGSALIASLFHPTTPVGSWVAFEILGGLGRGASGQIPVQMAQQNIPKSSLAVGTAIVSLFNYFRLSLTLAISETVLSNSLKQALKVYAPGIDPQIVIDNGATNILQQVPVEYMKGVKMAYNQAVKHVFWLAMAAAAVSVATSFGMGWKKVEKKQQKTAQKSPVAQVVETVEGKAGS